MNFAELVKLVPEQWQLEFTQFVTTGDGTDEFLAFVDSHEPTQRAVEAALSAQMESFERFIRHLNVDPLAVTEHMKRIGVAPDDEQEASSKIASGLRVFMSLPAHKKARVAHRLAEAVGPKEVRQGFEDIEVAIGR